MLSKKLTFSLTSLVILLTIGFIVTPYGIAHEKEIELADGSKIKVNPTHPKPTLSVASNDDLSSAAGAQVMRPTATDGTTNISVLIDFSTPVSILEEPASNATAAVAADGDKVDISDIMINAYNKDGIAVSAPNLNAADSTSTLMRGNPDNGKNAILVIADAALTTDGWAAIDTLYISIPETKFKNADRTLNAQAYAHAVNVTSDVLVITLVGADDGDAKYRKPPYDTGDAVAAGTPGVVSITRTLDPSGFAQAAGGPFTVRIILTEEPKAFTAAHIVVDGGTATVSAPAMGLPIEEDDLTNIIAGGGYATTDDLPDPTGRDDMYHQYSVMITPAAGFDGDLMFSVAQFEDMVTPVSKEYVPLSKAQRLDTTLTGTSGDTTTGEQVDFRDDRITNGRELLTVRVHTIADQKVAAANTAYAARKTLLDANPNVKVLGGAPDGDRVDIVIPANGYLVLAKGKTDSDPISGVVSVSAKIAEKKTPAQKLYNVIYDFGLPFPADDLSNFFRNGGSLSLVHGDIPEATGSGHVKSIASQSGDATHADYTGYTGATSTAIASGAVIINEIMWGLDANSPNAQYIELHNTTAADIGLDHGEWAIAVGSVPTGLTAIDTMSNNPASGYWQVPGSDGVSSIEPSAGFFALVDIVSTSRMMGAADGTAAASWAASMRPSANISGRRIGTPGAANVYVKPAPPPAPTPTPPAAKAPVASVGDLMVTEIMVDTGSGGNLPQWIEISNVSGAAVRLMGWSLNVDNDPSDAVVLPSLNIQLGDVTVGADQSALVISKESNRNSGVGTGDTDAAAGMIRSERIVNAGLDPHAFLSSMSFRIGLVPPTPQTTGAVGRGDVAGNLQQGWELPMAEGNARSSLIRRDMNDKGEVMGTDAAGWVLASTTSHVAIVPYETYYGDAKDQGSPGIYKAGSALPVELSKFGAKRDPLTGQVVITWETQSELNNAGFFIKRSQQKNSQFVAVNPTMIPGAGTTSEKQSYTYTDTTAKPNIVYYYQIEDVSLDGNRQTLTRAHRLKGHVGAAGKATTTWGELKTSRQQ